VETQAEPLTEEKKVE
jgi:hypothetical protein